MKSRIIAAAITAASLLALPAFAADTAPAPLAPGNPAGTRQAALLAASPFLLLGAVALVVVVAVAASNGSSNSSSSTGTSS